MFWRRKDRELRDEMAEVDDIAGAWSRACSAVGLVRNVETVSGTTEVVPRIDHVTLGPPTVLSVRLNPGMLPADITGASQRLAPALGAAGLRVEPRGLSHAIVTLLNVDPLAATVTLPDYPMTGPILVAFDENGNEITVEPARLPHLAVQGSTRSGKSVWCYSLLSQLSGRDDVRIAGVDGSGLLLRPYAVDPLRAVGLAVPSRVEAALTGLVAEMDRRVSAMPLDRDTVDVSAQVPLIVVVLEEYPGVLRALDAIDPKAAKRVRLLVARLLAESAKAGFSVVMIAQRCEAQIIGAAERAQMAGRVSFRVDTPESVKLLHPDAAESVGIDHTNAPQGVALMTLPGHRLSRVRSPLVSYADYVKAVQQ